MKIGKILSFILLAAALAACSSTTAGKAVPTVVPTVKPGTTTIAQGRLEPIRYAEIALDASGLVSEVTAHEGDSVVAGQIIARLQSDQAQTLEGAQARASQRLSAAYQALRDAQYTLDNFDVPSDLADLTPSEAVSQTLDKLNAARDAYEPYRYIYYDNKYQDLNLSDPKLYKLASNHVNAGALEAKKALDDAWAKYRRAVQWMGLETDLETAQTNLDQAQKDNAGLQDASFAEDTAGTRAALANAELRAPFGGTITNLDLKLGQFAASGQPVLTIADLSNWLVKTTDLTEIDVVNVKEGQQAEITLDALPDVTLKGNVLTISQAYSEKQGDIVYEVTILLTDKNPAMRWGMTAEVSFIR
ncbi:MAG TPA: efflux RND transporter periplasmic adaptor subunit [Anaerolineales bacterium]|nr:efflux RND transporter periplasmic adaptor subunit [Anaerolineales bacterium]